MSMLTPFHLAIQVRDIDEARTFYTEILVCNVGRSSDLWVDLDLYGHQLVCHLNPSIGREGKISSHTNAVDGHGVPVPHFGVVLELADWQQLADRLQQLNIEFIIEPYIRFKGEAGEQATLFFMDPSGNAIEFKAFKDINQLFAS